MGSVPRSHTPSAPVHDHSRRPQPNPSRAPQRSAILSPLPKEVRSSTRPALGRRRSPGSSGRREARKGRRRQEAVRLRWSHSAPRYCFPKYARSGASRKQLMRPLLGPVTRMASQWRVEPEVPGWAAARDCHDCTNLPWKHCRDRARIPTSARNAIGAPSPKQIRFLTRTFGSTREPFSPPC